MRATPLCLSSFQQRRRQLILLLSREQRESFRIEMTFRDASRDAMLPSINIAES